MRGEQSRRFHAQTGIIAPDISIPLTFARYVGCAFCRGSLVSTYPTERLA
jgi:hypothetical protein